MATYMAPGAHIARILTGTLQLASAERTLPMLCGVRLVTDGGKLLAAATDRYIAGVALMCDAGDGAADDLYLATEDVKRLAAAAKANRSEPIILELSPDGATIRTMAGDLTVRPGDGSPPDVLTLMRTQARAVMDGSAPAEALDGSWALDPAVYAKLAKLGASDRVRLRGGSARKPVIWATDDAFGCIMPVRWQHGEEFALPGWAL